MTPENFANLITSVALASAFASVLGGFLYAALTDLLARLNRRHVAPMTVKQLLFTAALLRSRAAALDVKVAKLQSGG
jgi:hypothetical protein